MRVIHVIAPDADPDSVLGALSASPDARVHCSTGFLARCTDPQSALLARHRDFRIFEDEYLHPQDSVVYGFVNQLRHVAALAIGNLIAQWGGAGRIPCAVDASIVASLADRLFNSLRLDFGLQRAIADLCAQGQLWCHNRGRRLVVGDVKQWIAFRDRSRRRPRYRQFAADVLTALSRGTVERRLARDAHDLLYESSFPPATGGGSPIWLFLLDRSVFNDAEHQAIARDIAATIAQRGESHCLGIGLRRGELEWVLGAAEGRLQIHGLGARAGLQARVRRLGARRIAGACATALLHDWPPMPFDFRPGADQLAGSLEHFLAYDLRRLADTRRYVEKHFSGRQGRLITTGGIDPCKAMACGLLEERGFDGVTYYHLFASRHARFRMPLTGHIAVRDPVSAMALSSLAPGKAPGISVVGSPSLEKYAAAPLAAAQRSTHRPSEAGSGKTILLLTQWHYFSRCSELLRVLRGLIDVEPDCFLRLRMHPREAPFARFAYENILAGGSATKRWEIAAAEPLAELLSRSDLVVTLFSNAALDAAAAGVPVICVQGGEEPDPVDLSAAGIATGVKLTEFAGFMLSLRRDPGQWEKLVDDAAKRRAALGPIISPGSINRLLDSISGR